MKVVLYEVTIEDEAGNWQYFATLKAARTFAKENAPFQPTETEINRVTTISASPKSLAAILLNGQGWCAETVTVATYPCKESAS